MRETTKRERDVDDDLDRAVDWSGPLLAVAFLVIAAVTAAALAIFG